MAFGVARALYFWAEVRSLPHPVIEPEFKAIRFLLGTPFLKFDDASFWHVSAETVQHAVRIRHESYETEHFGCEIPSNDQSGVPRPTGRRGPPKIAVRSSRCWERCAPALVLQISL